MSELVKALRDAYEETDKVYFNLRTIIKDAADTIDRLTAENAELLQKTQQLTAERDALRETVDDLKGRLWQYEDGALFENDG